MLMRTILKKLLTTLLTLTFVSGLMLAAAACNKQVVESASQQQSNTSSEMDPGISATDINGRSGESTPEANGRLVDVVLCTSCGCIRIGHSLDDLEPGHEEHGFCWSQYWVYD